MKPRLNDADQKIDIGDTVTCANHTSGSENDASIPNTVSRHKPETNKKVVPNVVSGPKPN